MVRWFFARFAEVAAWTVKQRDHSEARIAAVRRVGIVEIEVFTFLRIGDAPALLLAEGG